MNDVLILTHLYYIVKSFCNLSYNFIMILDLEFKSSECVFLVILFDPTNYI